MFQMELFAIIYKKIKKLTWQEKVNIVHYIIQDLAIVHKAELYHGLVTTLTILMNGDWAYLVGLDFSKNVDLVTVKHEKIFGVLPFVSPEVLRDKLTAQSVQSADIYSIGIVMSEIASGSIPFRDEREVYIALDVCSGMRPEIKDSTPEAYRKIMEACWDSDPLKRPDIFKLQSIFTKWRQNPPFNITQQFEQADDLDAKNNDMGNVNLFFFIHVLYKIIIIIIHYISDCRF